MAELLARKLYFPCASVRYRSLMAANTHVDGSGPRLRLVAFEDAKQAKSALYQARRTELRLVVGPALSYRVPRLARGAATEVWHASALDVAGTGMCEFHMDVCSLGPRGTLTITSSWSVHIERMDAELARLNLTLSWNL